MSDPKLQELAQVLNLWKEAELKMTRLEMELAEAKKECVRFEEDVVPNMMSEFGFTSVELEDGREVSTKPELYCSITGEKTEEAMDWLMSVGAEALIRHNVSIKFGVKEEDLRKAQELADMLIAHGIEYEDKLAVHPGSLKSFLKGRLNEGLPVPLDTFSARPVEKAVVKEIKKHKKKALSGR